MRVANVGSIVVAAWLASSGPVSADPQGAQLPICVLDWRNEIELSATLGSDGCPQLDAASVDPTCLAVTYSSRSWPVIRWRDVSPQATQVRWQIDPVPGNAHAHLGTIPLDWARDAGVDTPSVQGGHASGSCTWYYRVTAVARRASDGGECSASLDPGIRFNPGGGGTIATKLLLAALGVATLALLVQLWHSARIRRTE